MENRFFLVKWKDWRQPTWEPTRHLCKNEDEVAEFWALHPELCVEDAHEREGEHRCEWCCKGINHTGKIFKNARGLAVHQRSCYEKPSKRSTASATHRAAARLKRAAEATKKAVVQIEGQNLKNVSQFCYLGMAAQYDGDPEHTIKDRMVKAKKKIVNFNRGSGTHC